MKNKKVPLSLGLPCLGKEEGEGKGERIWLETKKEICFYFLFFVFCLFFLKTFLLWCMVLFVHSLLKSKYFPHINPPVGKIGRSHSSHSLEVIKALGKRHHTGYLLSWLALNLAACRRVRGERKNRPWYLIEFSQV